MADAKKKNTKSLNTKSLRRPSVSQIKDKEKEGENYMSKRASLPNLSGLKPSENCSLYSLFWVHNVKLVTKEVNKGDYVYYRWSIDEFKGVSGATKVKNPQKISWPKASKFSFHSTIGNSGKENKFLTVIFHKSQTATVSDIDIKLGQIIINMSQYVSFNTESMYVNVKYKTFTLQELENSNSKQTTKISIRTRLGLPGQNFKEGEASMDFSEASCDMTTGDNSEKKSDSEEDKVLELSLENETLKKQYREILVKNEKEKRDQERNLKQAIDEKKKKTRNSNS